MKDRASPASGDGEPRRPPSASGPAPSPAARLDEAPAPFSPTPERPADRPPGEGEPRRTHPLGLLVSLAEGLRQSIIPAIAASFAMREEGWGIAYGLGVILLVASTSLLVAWWQWLRLTYLVTDQDIRVESGIIARAARSVPFERIQDVSIEQALVPRLLGLVTVKLETGAGGGDDLVISYLSESEGAALRDLVRMRRASTAGEGAGSGDGHALAGARAGGAASGHDGQLEEQDSEVLFAMDARRLIRFGLFEFSLAAVAVLFAASQQFDFLLPFDPWDPEFWQQQLAPSGTWLAQLGPTARILGAAVAGFSLLLLGVVTGITRTVLRDWGFVLERTPRAFRRRRGLLTRSDVVMPIRRVQAMILSSGLLRYRFGWHALHFVSLAQDSGAAHHVVAPFARIEEIEPIIRAAGFEPPSDRLDWQPSSRWYWMDRSAIASAPPLMLALTLALVAPKAGPLTGSGALWLLLAAGLALLVAAVNFLRWRVHRHAMDESQLYLRRGVLVPKWQFAPKARFHSVEIVQGPLARRHGYATLHLGLAGGSFSLVGIPVERAREWRRSILAAIRAAPLIAAAR